MAAVVLCVKRDAIKVYLRLFFAFYQKKILLVARNNNMTKSNKDLLAEQLTQKVIDLSIKRMYRFVPIVARRAPISIFATSVR